jgi:hypothetical protein
MRDARRRRLLGHAPLCLSLGLLAAADPGCAQGGQPRDRWGPEERFRIVVLRPGQDGVEECVAGEAFDRWFFQTTEMYHGAALEYPVAAKPEDWAVFELIKYETPVEDNDKRMLLPTRPGEPIIVEWAHIPGQYPSEWDPDLFALVKQGCAGLGARP